MRVLGYVRVSTEEQAISGVSLEVQRQAIVAECERQGWQLVEVVEDAGFSAKDLRRPGIRAALEELAGGRADALVVSKLDRLSRSMLDFTGLLRLAQKQRWSLVALDCVDTSTPGGEAMAHVLATFAQLERRLISQRTKNAMAEKKAQGARFGRPRKLSGEIRARIRRERDAGGSWSSIAAALNSEGVPTAQGGVRWYPSTVRKVYIGTTAKAVT
jgi:DNA invertase Pin-like site-specific DNA recombinase